LFELAAFLRKRAAEFTSFPNHKQGAGLLKSSFLPVNDMLATVL
jgi:hypothetical protein